MLFKDGECNEDVKVTAVVIGPQRLPQPQNICPLELALVPDKEHAEKEKEIGRVSGLEMEIEFGVHELHQVIERHELLAHTRLITKEVSLLHFR